MENGIKSYPVLEIALSRAIQAREGVYRVELCYIHADPDDHGEVTPASGSVTIDFAQLSKKSLTPGAYGYSLSDMVFAEEKLRDWFQKAKVKGQNLRIRVRVDPDATELYEVRWELLTAPRDLQTGLSEHLAASERTPFSRLIGGQDWRAVKLPKLARSDDRKRIKALIAVSARRWCMNPPRASISS